MNPQQRQRKRGVILTNLGLQKLEAAKREAESCKNSEKRYTLEDLSSHTGLDSDTLMKVFSCQVKVDKRTLNTCFQAFHLKLETNDYYFPSTPELTPTTQFWGEAPDVSMFYGRTTELTTLKHWIIEERCRMVTLLGMGGVGKTWMSVKLARHLLDDFQVVIWQSLRNSPPIPEMLADLIQCIVNEPEIDLPTTVQGRISLLMNYLKRVRCLLILDNVETILVDTSVTHKTGYFRPGYEGYGQFFRQVGEANHQSCLVLTSREKPKQIGRMEGETLPVRVLQLQGLQTKEVQEIFNAKGSFWGSQMEWHNLIERYAGNPLALNIVSTTIQKLFDGQIGEFLQQDIVVFGEIYHLVKQHINRLSNVENQIIKWLAINYQPISFSELRSQISPSISPQQLLEALESLQERSLIQKSAACFSLSPIVKKYLNNQLTENKTHYKIKSRDSQTRLIKSTRAKKKTLI
ncbi:MAG: NB-ARC domain-containing protein [Nostoc sp. LLA-1]|nr:NB-ARC domain-containing protein [Cyanocohniella sp. LLY]